MNDLDLELLCQLAIDAALSAGAVISGYAKKEVEVEYKAISSSLATQVVTEVDRQAQTAILKILQPICDKYNLALLSEELADDGLRQQKPAFWCIDPMDGTLAFINKTRGYSVSIALVSQTGKPLIAVIYDPVEENLYHAIDGQGAFKNRKTIYIPAINTDQPLTLQTDTSFSDHPWYEQTLNGLLDIASQLGLDGAEIVYNSGAVMNACRVLEQANACYFKYPRKGNSGGSLWDYAATACLFIEAGAIASDIYGFPMALNRAETTFMNHQGIIYAGNKKVAELIMQLASGLLRS